jgi:hypothetical protein
MARSKRIYAAPIVLTVAALSVAACGPGVSTNPPEPDPEGVGGSSNPPVSGGTGGETTDPSGGTGGGTVDPCTSLEISCNPPEPFGGFGGMGGAGD